MRMIKRQSMMSQPTFIRMPARTAWGIDSTYPPSPRTKASSIADRSTPDICVRPPARMLITVPKVAPAPGRPQINPAATLPMPWPTSSRLALWRVRVIESATSEVSKLSMEPSRAIVTAGSTAPTSASRDRDGSFMSGRPVGTLPMTGVLVSHRTPKSVPTINAAKGGGRYFLSLPGQITPHEEGGCGDDEGAEVDVGQSIGPPTDCIHRSTLGDRSPQEGQGVHQYDDYANAGHEPGNHGVGCESYETSDPH